MPRTAFFVTLMLAACASPAQYASNPADSLSNLLKHQSADTNRVSLLMKLADAIVYENPSDAMRYAEEGMQLSESLHWQTGVALAYRQKGVVYYVMSDHVNAMDCYQKALQAAEPLRNEKFDASVQVNLANIYADLTQYGKALEHYRAALPNLHDRKFETIVLQNMGTVYTEMNDFGNALDCLKKGYTLAVEDGNLKNATVIQNNIGTVYGKSGDHRNAVAYYKKAIALGRETGNKSIIAMALNGLAKEQLHLGADAEAEMNCRESIEISHSTRFLQTEVESFQTLSDIYESRHDGMKALDAYKQYVALRDSMMNDEKKDELTRKEMQFEQDKKSALAASAIDHQRVLRNATMAGSAVLIAALLLSVVLYNKKRNADVQKREAEFKAEVADTEMKALRSQMNPHFIFNALNSIGDYVSKHDIQSAGTFLTKFAKLMRLILENSEKKEVALAEDLQALELYLQLETLRLQNGFSYEIQVDPRLDKDNTMIPPLLLQPFVENSIWHGFSGKTGEGKILVRIVKEGGTIRCVVEDNGVGRKRSAARIAAVEKQSLGMRITRTRIDIINRVQQTNGSVELSDLDDGTRVELKLPLVVQF